MKKYLAGCLSLVAVTLGSNAVAQNATTTPVGAMTTTIAGSNGVAYKITPLSVNLENSPPASGLSTGRISSITSNSVSVTGAGWQPSELSTPSLPCFLKITSGAGAGRTFLITANTVDSVTLNTQSLDLTLLGLATGAQGDTFELITGTTLLNLLGTNVDGVIGGSSANATSGLTDKVLMNDANGVVRTYYFDTTAVPAQWRRIGSSVNQDTAVISPLSGILYYRIGVPSIQIAYTGRVPTTISQRQVSTTGTSVLSTVFPADYTLSSLSLQTSQSWRKLNDSGVVLNSTDRVLVPDALGVIRSYYHDGTTWRRVGSGADQAAVSIPAGTAIYVTRFGSIGSALWSQQLPYNLNN
jgi:uncharacterized protein (TIGR02597 family)